MVGLVGKELTNRRGLADKCSMLFEVAEVGAGCRPCGAGRIPRSTPPGASPLKKWPSALPPQSSTSSRRGGTAAVGATTARLIGTRPRDE